MKGSIVSLFILVVLLVIGTGCKGSQNSLEPSSSITVLVTDEPTMDIIEDPVLEPTSEPTMEATEDPILEPTIAPAVETTIDLEEQLNQDQPFLPDVDLPRVELMTSTEGVGVKPRFEWNRLEGAVWYSLVLLDADGNTYWAWMGTETFTYLGNSFNAPPADSAGPILGPGMAWAVVAYDSEDLVIGASSIRPISP